MAVTYMKRLEEEPDTYDEQFTNLTKGINLEVFNWILGNLEDELEIYQLILLNLRET